MTPLRLVATIYSPGDSRTRMIEFSLALQQPFSSSVTWLDPCYQPPVYVDLASQAQASPRRESLLYPPERQRLHTSWSESRYRKPVHYATYVPSMRTAGVLVPNQTSRSVHRIQCEIQTALPERDFSRPYCSREVSCTEEIPREYSVRRDCVAGMFGRFRR